MGIPPLRKLSGDEQHQRDIELLIEVAKGYGVEIQTPQMLSLVITATRILEKMVDRTDRPAALAAYKDCHRENECGCCEKHPDSKDDRCYIGACIWDLEEEVKKHGKDTASAAS